MPVHSGLCAILLLISSNAAPARADAVSLIAATRNEPSSTTSSAFDADHSVAFEKALDSGEARCLVSNQLLYVSKRHWSLQEHEETNKIKRSAEQSSGSVSFIGPFDRHDYQRTYAWTIEEIGEDEESHDESARNL